MTENSTPGWYSVEHLPQGTVRYWDGQQWTGDPVQANQINVQDNSASHPSELASPWQRLGARIIDGLILFIPSMAILLPVLIPAIREQIEAVERGDSVPPGQPAGVLIASVAIGLLSVAYEFFFLSRNGATPGKKVAGVKVVRTNGSNIDSTAVAKRVALTVGTIFIGLIPILGNLVNSIFGIALAIMIFVDKKRQTPSDKLADTIVTKS